MSNKKFDINEIDNIAVEQRNVKGLLTLLSDTLQLTLEQINSYDYDNVGKIPHDIRTGVIVQLLHDRNSLYALLTYLEKANLDSIKVLDEQVNNYYEQRKGASKHE
ncbi:hypothetical protein [Limosilactobacillus oris]|uniref:hypothetical protein n=1 Tax=Limosilactobacillus oris TaxID=1632 RepID=UPI0024B3614A|nr:hypothetical protein [Limosilactobacillus oris]WHO85096.1 hypothetical protein QLX69_06905 [Limosilactobacillus oris]